MAGILLHMSNGICLGLSDGQYFTASIAEAAKRQVF